VIQGKNPAQDKGDGIDGSDSHIGFHRNRHANGKHEISQKTERRAAEKQGIEKFFLNRSININS
jgi:hypothetical protein